jgi:hypothetical protein
MSLTVLTSVPVAIDYGYIGEEADDMAHKSRSASLQRQQYAGSCGEAFGMLTILPAAMQSAESCGLQTY